MKLTDARNTPLEPQAVSELRHELRTPVNLIVGYCEMLLEDATGPENAGRRKALEESLEAVREVLARINSGLPSAGAEVTERDVAALYEALREPQGRIVRAMTELLAAANSAQDEGFKEDVSRIRSAAERLIATNPATDASDQPSAADPPREETEPESARAATAGARILVVDDIEDNRSVLERRLRREGYDVECAENGRRALEMVGESAFDLVLLDVMMPEIDGFEVLEQLKKEPATRDIPVIMISALDDLASTVRCIESGAEDYLPKPFDPVLLRARIGACLEKKRLRDAELEYLQQVGRVIDAATTVEAGNYNTGALADVAARADELGRLARVFDAMATEVRAREDRLRGQVDELKKEIEAARNTGQQAAEEASEPILRKGEVVSARYEIRHEVGSGGMGMVYRARDRELDEDVALKTLRPQFLTDPELVERFKSEIRLARRITHRNVVRTHDIGEWSGGYYLTMEYVEGITVRELIDTRGRLAVAATLAIARQLADSLAVAHQQGVIHRDVKPQNLLLDAEGALKVMDFGVACLAEQGSTSTAAGLIVGTPAYMSPEQLLGESIDARTDLFAVGVVLYECLTGRLPLEAKSPVALIAKLMTEEPAPVTEVNSDVPPAFSELIVHLLAKEPSERLGSAAELGERLTQIG